MIPQLQREKTVSAPETTAQWSLPLKVAFRFSFAYFILYAYPYPIGSLDQDTHPKNFMVTFWHAVVPWVGANVLHIKDRIVEISNGSGDLIYDFVLWLCVAVGAVLVTVVWSFLDRKRSNYARLNAWLRVMMRLVIAVPMIGYGSNKLFRAQFPAPSLVRLFQPYGQTSPMDLLWTFMGMSRAYSFFGGVGEMLGGVLLLLPGVTTIGALVAGAMVTNILMLNLCYDVPRKIYVTHLLLFCGFLLLPDMRRLLNFFILNRPAQLSKPIPPFKDKTINRIFVTLIALVAVGLLVDRLQYSHRIAANGSARLSADVRGAWNIDEFTLDGVVHPPLMTDPERWRRFILDKPGWMVIQPMQAGEDMYYSTVDTTKKTIALWKPDKENQKDILVYTFVTPDKMDLEGAVNGHRIEAKMTRIPLSDPVDFRLTNRGLHLMSPDMNYRQQF